MKKILFLLALLPCLAFGQKTTSLNKSGSGEGDVMKSDSTTLFVTITQLQDSIATLQSQLDAINTELDDTFNIETTQPMLDDTITFLAFNFGSGQLGDTALFANNALLGMADWNTSDSGIVTKLKCRMLAGSGTETVIINVCWDTDTIMAVVPVRLNTAGYTLSNLKFSNTDVSFNNSIIPPDNVVYAYMSGISAGNKPSFVGCSVQGHKQNRRY